MIGFTASGNKQIIYERTYRNVGSLFLCVTTDKFPVKVI